MNSQEKTGWTLVAVVLLLLWWLSRYGLSFLHGTTTAVSTRIVGPDDTTIQETAPTVTTYPDATGSPSPCCS